MLRMHHLCYCLPANLRLYRTAGCSGPPYSSSHSRPQQWGPTQPPLYYQCPRRSWFARSWSSRCAGWRATTKPPSLTSGSTRPRRKPQGRWQTSLSCGRKARPVPTPSSISSAPITSRSASMSTAVRKRGRLSRRAATSAKPRAPAARMSSRRTRT